MWPNFNFLLFSKIPTVTHFSIKNYMRKRHQYLYNIPSVTCPHYHKKINEELSRQYSHGHLSRLNPAQEIFGLLRFHPHCATGLKKLGHKNKTILGGKIISFYNLETQTIPSGCGKKKSNLPECYRQHTNDIFFSNLSIRSFQCLNKRYL